MFAGSDSSQIRLNGNLLPSLSSSSWKHYTSSSSASNYYVFDSYNLAGGGEISIWSDNYSDKILAVAYGMAEIIGYSYTGNLNLRPSGGIFCVHAYNCVCHIHICYQHFLFCSVIFTFLKIIKLYNNVSTLLCASMCGCIYYVPSVSLMFTVVL